MFSVGEYVACGSKGVCVVQDITTLKLPGVDQNRKYYILKPIYNAGTTVYVPLDSGVDTIRAVLGAEEAKRLVEAYPSIPLLSIPNEKMFEQTYKECMKTGSCEEWAKVLKTINDRKEKRLSTGRRMTAVDAKYIHIVEDSLYGELAFALNIPREKMADYLAKNTCLS